MMSKRAMEYRLSKECRLLRPTEFQRVLAARASAANGIIRMHGARNGLTHPRLGLTVSRKAGGAVIRNRWKRIIREAFRVVQREFPLLDVVCTPQNQSLPKVEQLVVSLPRLAERIVEQLARREQTEGQQPTPRRGSPT